MPPISRGQRALRVGESIRQLGVKLSDPSKATLVFEALVVARDALSQLVYSCREAKSMYLSLPRVRAAILDAGEEFSAHLDKLDTELGILRDSITANDTNFDRSATELIRLGANIKLVSFEPREKPLANANAVEMNDD